MYQRLEEYIRDTDPESFTRDAGFGNTVTGLPNAEYSRRDRTGEQENIAVGGLEDTQHALVQVKAEIIVIISYEVYDSFGYRRSYRKVTVQNMSRQCTLRYIVNERDPG